VTPFEVYGKYVAIKAHFNTKYDYIKFNGKIKTNYSTFEKRKDKVLFIRLANKNWDYIIPFMIANFVANENLWIGDLILNAESETTYFAWKKKRARIYTETRTELEAIQKFIEKHDLHFNDLFKIDNEKLPIIFRLMIQRFISMETYLILDMILHFSKSFESLLDNPIYSKWEFKLRKYNSFLALDEKRCRDLVTDVFLNNA